MEKCFLEQWQGFDVKMYQNCQKMVKTSELEDQDAVILGLAVWPEEPREFRLFQKELGFTKNVINKVTTVIKN